MFGNHHALQTIAVLLLTFAGGVMVGCTLAAVWGRQQGARAPDPFPGPLGEGPLLPEDLHVGGRASERARER
jgi:hypothetical protein